MKVMRRVVLAAMALVVIGCGGSDYALVGTPAAPGADGVVEVEKIDGGNRMVTVTLEHLLPPDRLGSYDNYTMWFQGKDQPPVKMGVLDYDKDDRTGKIMATTPLKSFGLKITAESGRDSVAPSDAVVAKQSIKE